MIVERTMIAPELKTINFLMYFNKQNRKHIRLGLSWTKHFASFALKHDLISLDKDKELQESLKADAAELHVMLKADTQELQKLLEF